MDYETIWSYTVTVIVTDPSGARDTITVTVDVNNVDEDGIDITGVNEVPMFPSGSDTRSIAENTQQGENIGAPVSAEDPDPGDTLTYTLGGPDWASSISCRLPGNC